MPYGNSESTVCFVCKQTFPHFKKLSEHIKKIHHISPHDYYIKYCCNNVMPACPLCGIEPRYVSLSEGFKKYCKEHATAAMSSGGLIGGQAPAWNRGMSKETDNRLFQLSLKMSGNGNHFFGKKHSEITKMKNAQAHRLKFVEVLQSISSSVSSVTVLSDWRDYDTQNSLLHVSCKVCSSVDDVSFFNLKRCWRCKKCHPSGSRQQQDVSDFVKSFGFNVIDSTRQIIPPLELDIWIPEKNIAIEYHGLYWHSNDPSDAFDKKRHRMKYEACRSRGIKLIQIFSDEWINKNDICKSIIRNALGKNETVLNGRDCTVEHIDIDIAKKFLDSTHISGYTRSKHKIGLFHKNLGLVGVATTRTPIQTKWGHVSELARLSFLQGFSVRGGASKLISVVKRLAIEEGFEGVLSYADLRFGDGGVYLKCGMEEKEEAKLNYWYTDGHKRIDRFAFRTQPGKPETDIAKHEGVMQVWGAGNKVFVWRK